MKLKYIKCSICDCESYIYLFSAKDNRLHTSDQEFNVVKCKNCGLVYINPQPTSEELNKFYPSNYHEPYSPLYLKLDWVFRLTADIQVKQLLKQIEKLKNGNRVLDVGCGTGWLSQSFQRAGYKVFGVEPNAGLYKIARKILGVDVWNSFLADCNFKDSHFDIVVMRQVLEHITEPNVELSQIHRILKPDGILYVEVPNFHCLEGRLFRKYWYSLDIPRHLYQYTTDLLINIARKNGFEPSVILKNHAMNIFIGPLATVKSFEYFYDKKISSKTVKKIIAWISFIPLLILTLLFRIISEKHIEIIFKKR